MLKFYYKPYEIYINDKIIGEIFIPCERNLEPENIKIYMNYIYYEFYDTAIQCGTFYYSDYIPNLDKIIPIINDNKIYINTHNKDIRFNVKDHTKPLKIIIGGSSFDTVVSKIASKISINRHKSIIYGYPILSKKIRFGEYTGENELYLNANVPIIDGIANFDVACMNSRHQTIDTLSEYVI